MQMNQFIDQRQPDASALQGAAALPLDPVEPIEDVRQFGLGDSDTGVAHGQDHRLAIRGGIQSDENPASQSVFKGIRHEVEDNPLPHLGIDIDRTIQPDALGLQVQAGAVAGGPEIARQFLGVFAQLHRLEAGLDAPGLDTGEIQQGVHQPQQAQSIAVDHRQPLSAVSAVSAKSRDLLFQRAEHQGQRRTKFMADIGEKRCLRLVDLRQGFCLPALGFIGPRRSEAGGDLRRDQVDES